MAAKKVKFNYLVGRMIEVPQGALTAGEIAQTAEFWASTRRGFTSLCGGGDAIVVAGSLADRTRLRHECPNELCL